MQDILESVLLLNRLLKEEKPDQNLDSSPKSQSDYDEKEHLRIVNNIVKWLEQGIAFVQKNYGLNNIHTIILKTKSNDGTPYYSEYNAKGFFIDNAIKVNGISIINDPSIIRAAKDFDVVVSQAKNPKKFELIHPTEQGTALNRLKEASEYTGSLPISVRDSIKNFVRIVAEDEKTPPVYKKFARVFFLLKKQR